MDIKEIKKRLKTIRENTLRKRESIRKQREQLTSAARQLEISRAETKTLQESYRGLERIVIELKEQNELLWVNSKTFEAMVNDQQLEIERQKIELRKQNIKIAQISTELS